MKSKLDIDDIRTLMEVIGQKPNTQTVVPTVQVQTDKDTFSTFTGGLSRGWPFILAMVSIAFWVVQSIFGINSALAAHQAAIDRNSAAINAITSKLDTAETTSNTIVRSIDSLQKDIDIIKTK